MKRFIYFLFLCLYSMTARSAELTLACTGIQFVSSSGNSLPFEEAIKVVTLRIDVDNCKEANCKVSADSISWDSFYQETKFRNSLNRISGIWINQFDYTSSKGVTSTSTVTRRCEKASQKF